MQIRLEEDLIRKGLGQKKNQKQVLSFIYLKDFSFCAGDFLKLNSIDF